MGSNHRHQQARLRVACQQDSRGLTWNYPDVPRAVSKIFANLFFVHEMLISKCLVLKYSVVESMLLYNILEVLAKKHPTRKFMRCVATKVVENYRDQDCPGLLFYKDGNNLLNNLTGQTARQLFGGKRMNVDTVEYVLGKECNFLDVKFDDDPRDSLKTFNAFIHKKKALLGRDEDQSGSDGEDDREYMNNQLFRYKHKTK